MATFIKPLSYQELQKKLIAAQTENTKLKKVYRAVFSGKHSEWVFESLHNGGKIYIQTLTGERFPVTVSSSDTIADLKDKLETVSGIQAINSRLVFGSKQMHNHRRLFYYRVPVGATVYLVVNMHAQKKLGLSLMHQIECNKDNFWIDYYTRKLIEERQFNLQYNVLK